MEEGVWGRNLAKLSLPLAQRPKTLPLKKRYAIKRMNAIRLVTGAIVPLQSR